MWDEPEGFRGCTGEEKEDWYEPKETSGGRVCPDASPDVSLRRLARPRIDIVVVVDIVLDIQPMSHDIGHVSNPA